MSNEPVPTTTNVPTITNELAILSEKDGNNIRKIREWTSVWLALPIVFVFLVGLGVAFTHEIGDFTHVKDLLSFLSPLVGIVIGYYFSKVTTEARAESAEKSAKDANANLTLSTESSKTANENVDKARNERKEAQDNAQNLRGGLSQLMEASRKYLDTEVVTETNDEEPNLVMGDPATPPKALIKPRVVPDAHKELRTALDKAQDLLS